jgi:hypothetical protein
MDILLVDEKAAPRVEWWVCLWAVWLVLKRAGGMVDRKVRGLVAASVVSKVGEMVDS